MTIAKELRLAALRLSLLKRLLAEAEAAMLKAQQRALGAGWTVEAMSREINRVDELDPE